MKKVIIILLVLAVPGYIIYLVKSAPVDSLEEWVELTSLPGFTLLDSVEAKGYYFAVYDTGQEEIAVCYYWHSDAPTPANTSIAITDGFSQDLYDTGRAKSTKLERVHGIGNFGYKTRMGNVYPIRKGYIGSATVLFKIGRRKEVYEKQFFWPTDK